MLLNPYVFGGQLLLDLYPGAGAAYGLRQLRTAHNTGVVRIRRSTDNTEQDFTAPQITDGTLLSFCGAGNGFVQTWYDQSGNGRHATQSAQANQPLLVSGGVLLQKGTRPCVSFGTTQWLTGPATNYTGYSLFSVFDPRIALDGFCVFLGYGASGGTGAGFRPTLKLYDAGSIFNVAAADNTIALNQQIILSSVSAVSPSLLYKNGSLIATTAGTPASRTGWTLGKDPDKAAYSSGIAELIIYFSNQSANRAGIEQNINNNFLIY